MTAETPASTRCRTGRFIAEELVETWGSRDDSDPAVQDALARSHAVFYTPPSPRPWVNCATNWSPSPPALASPTTTVR
jgi:hypothetical protein